MWNKLNDLKVLRVRLFFILIEADKIFTVNYICDGCDNFDFRKTSLKKHNLAMLYNPPILS